MICECCIIIDRYPESRVSDIHPQVSTMPKFRRVHHTAIAIIPPEDAAIWERLGHIREKLRDKGFYRWPPHINLIYPFIDVTDMEVVVPALCDSLRNLRPFDISLSEFGVFGGGRSGVCWLSPEPRDDIFAVQRAIETALNIIEHNDDSGGREFVPHLTVSHFPNKQAATTAAEEEGPNWNPLSFPVGEVHIICREGPDGQFNLLWRIPLGGGEAVREGEGGRRYVYMPTVEPTWVHDMHTRSVRNGRVERINSKHHHSISATKPRK